MYELLFIPTGRRHYILCMTKNWFRTLKLCLAGKCQASGLILLWGPLAGDAGSPKAQNQSTRWPSPKQLMVKDWKPYWSIFFAAKSQPSGSPNQGVVETESYSVVTFHNPIDKKVVNFRQML